MKKEISDNFLSAIEIFMKNEKDEVIMSFYDKKLKPFIKKLLADADEKKTDAWEKNLEYISKNKEKWSVNEYDYPNKDGKFDWKYLLAHGKTQPDKLFGALYWKAKETLTNGEYKYQFNTKELAWAVFETERKTARKLASLLTVPEFIELLKKTDEFAYDARRSCYAFEWKLSTVVKQLNS